MLDALEVILTLVLLSLLAVTTVASFDRGVFEAGADLWKDPWFKATLADAYFGFLAVHLLIQLFRLPANTSLEELLLRKGA